MKHQTTRLNVDVIGGQGSLTKDDERLISEFIVAEKAAKTKQKSKKNKARITKG
jgi:hypothetical protein